MMRWSYQIILNYFRHPRKNKSKGRYVQQVKHPNVQLPLQAPCSCPCWREFPLSSCPLSMQLFPRSLNVGIYILPAFVLPFSWPIDVLQVTVPTFWPRLRLSLKQARPAIQAAWCYQLYFWYQLVLNALTFSSFFMKLISGSGRPSLFRVPQRMKGVLQQSPQTANFSS